MTLRVINWLLAACFVLTAPTITLAQQVDKKVTEGEVIVDSLSGAPGDPARGRLIVLSRQSGLCILCHSGPFPEERFQGNLAPDLAMSAARLSAEQLRARIVDASRFNPNTIMPPYFKKNHGSRVAPQFADKTILSAQEIEDVVAFLVSLKP
jgi:L-cysteine S-thiosulfotransferase